MSARSPSWRTAARLGGMPAVFGGLGLFQRDLRGLTHSFECLVLYMYIYIYRHSHTKIHVHI